MRPLLRKVLQRYLKNSQSQQTNVQPTAPLVYLRLRAARIAQVSFVELIVPNKP